MRLNHLVQTAPDLRLHAILKLLDLLRARSYHKQAAKKREADLLRRDQPPLSRMLLEEIHLLRRLIQYTVSKVVRSMWMISSYSIIT